MKALKFLGNSKSVIVDVPVPKPEKGQVLLKVMASAICGSERSAYKAEEPIDFISGHEFAGEVVETNQTASLKVGDRVTINVIYGCGE